MRNIFQKLNTFHVIFLISLLFISISLYFSIPSLFDYKKLQSKIENQIESDFDLKFANISNINYRFLPSPHLIIKEADLYFKNDSIHKISELNNTKVFISINKLYQNKKIIIKKILISNENFNFNFTTLNKFINHLQDIKNKEIIIKKSKFFYKNNKNEVSLISPIKNLNYQFFKKSKQKKLKIEGNLFDTNYNFKWDKDFNTNSFSKFILKFSNPNIVFENTFNAKNNLNKNGNLKINFLSKNLNVKYIFENNKLSFKTISNKFEPLNVKGIVEFSPFFFDIESTLENQKINFLINNILLNYFNYKEDVHKNINGRIKINFEKLNNALFKSGNIEFNFLNSKIILNKNKFQITKIGTIILRDSYFYENEGNIFFVSKIEVDIVNQKQFYRRFSIPIKNRINIKKVYAVIEKNIDNDEYAVLDISFNNEINFDLNLNEISSNNNNKLKFDNFQKFRNIIKDEFITN